MFQFRLRTLFAVTALVAVYLVAMQRLEESTNEVLTFSLIFWPTTLFGFILIDRIVQRWDGTQHRAHWPLAMGLSIAFSGGMAGVYLYVLSNFLRMEPGLAPLGFVCGLVFALPGLFILGFPLVALHMTSEVRMPYFLFGILWGGSCAVFTLFCFSAMRLPWQLLLFGAAFGGAIGLRLDSVSVRRRTAQPENSTSSHGV